MLRIPETFHWSWKAASHQSFHPKIYKIGYKIVMFSIILIQMHSICNLLEKIYNLIKFSDVGLA